MERIGVFDIESTDWIHFECLGAFDGKEYRFFTSIPRFLNYLNQKRYNGYTWYAHNGGKFDFLFLLEDMFKRGWISTLKEKQGGIMQIVCHTGTVHWQFHDSYMLLPASLRNLCETFKTAHRKLEMDYTQIDKTDKQTQDYLQNDVYALYEVLEHFNAEPFVHGLRLTLASQALDTFRKDFLNCQLIPMRLSEEELIRKKFYSGGRVEAYKGYGKRIHAYDVVSLYPTVMRNEMPVGKLHYGSRYCPSRIGFYRVEIRSTPDWYISPLIHRGSKLRFVTGAGEYWLGSPTLELLREEGVRFKVLDAWTFDGREHLFNGYVDYFFRMKTNAEKGSAQYLLAKLFLNSLYGKFGQQRWQNVLKQNDGTIDGAGLTDSSLDAYGMVLVKEETRSRFIMPYIAAYITELARAYHYRLMRPIADSVYYCDTDSIFTSRTMKTGSRLGMLSDEGVFEGVFLAAKTYAVRNRERQKVAFKGFNVAELRFKDLYGALTKRLTITQERDRILSYRECRTRVNGIADSAGDFLKLVKTSKQASLDNDKRFLYPSRSTVYDSRPFTIPQINSMEK